MGKIRSKKQSNKNTESQENLEQVVQYEKRIYDLEQLLDIAKSLNNEQLDNLIALAKGLRKQKTWCCPYRQHLDFCKGTK